MRVLAILCFVFTLMFFTNSQGQDFLFLSDRVPRIDPFDAEDSYVGQVDVFMYREGSEVRLTYTDTESEFDAVPSPDGRYMALASSSFVYPVELEASSWHYYVIDTLLGRRVASFEMPNSEGTLRPAGGFQITWLADGSAFLAQVPSSDFMWQIHKFDLESQTSEFLMDGFGVVLNDDATRLASSEEGQVKVLDLASGEIFDVIEGSPLAWTQDNHLLITQPNSFRLMDGVLRNGQEIFDFFGFYSGFKWSPARSNYAFVLAQQESWFVVAVEANHAFMNEFEIEGVIDSLDWLSETELLVSYLKSEDDFAIAKLNLDGSVHTIVDSWVHDYGVRVSP